MNSIIVPDTPTIQLTRTGVIFHGRPTLDEWLSKMDDLKEAEEALRWCQGDMILYAKSRVEWGEMYTQALDESEYSYHTLTQRVRVCKAFPYERRRPDIPWTHYQNLAAVPIIQQEQLLDDIEAGKIQTTDQTAAIVKEVRAQGHTSPDEPEPIEPEIIYPPCPCCNWPLKLHQGRCYNCRATVPEMAYRYRDLADAVRQLYSDGNRGPLDTFVGAYKILEEDR